MELHSQTKGISSESAVQQTVSLGLSKEEYLEQAVGAASVRGSLLDDTDGADLDLQFAAHRTILHRKDLRRFRDSCSSAIIHLAMRLKPLAGSTREAQPPTVQAVAGDMNLALVAVLVIVLQWPDNSLVNDFIAGFNVIGDIAPSGVYPLTPRSAGKEPTDLLEWPRNFSTSSSPP